MTFAAPTRPPRLLAGAILLGMALAASAQEAQIRKNLAERLPSFPKIENVSKTPFPGLYEVHAGGNLFYTDAGGNYVLQGELIDAKTRANLTEVRMEKLTRVDFATLPLQDAMVWKQGSGARKIALFSDPNCPYCKRFEKTLAQLKDVTVYTFLMPILGPDSTEKSRRIWCAADKTKVWHDWMLEGTAPAAPSTAAPSCDNSALDRNVAMGNRLRVTGTPGIVLANGRLITGAIDQPELELALAQVQAGLRAGSSR